jgi:hypothetical protein
MKTPPFRPLRYLDTKTPPFLSTQLPGYIDAVCFVHPVTWIQRRRLFCTLSYLDTKTPSVLYTQLPGYKDAVCSVHFVNWIQRRRHLFCPLRYLDTKTPLFCPLSYLDKKTPSVMSTQLPEYKDAVCSVHSVT